MRIHVNPTKLQEILQDTSTFYAQQAEDKWKDFNEFKSTLSNLDNTIKAKLLGKDHETNIFKALKRVEQNLSTKQYYSDAEINKQLQSTAETLNSLTNMIDYQFTEVFEKLKQFNERPPNTRIEEVKSENSE